jgi:UPF0755 protein
VIDSPFTLNVALLVEGTRSKVKAGEYLFKEQASLREVMDILVNGRQILHAVTIPEGLTSQQILDRLNENDVLLGDVKDQPKEGSLLPETYKVVRGTSRIDLIRKMQDDQRHIVDQIWARRAADLPLRSPYEMITLASIVEKETGKADERSRVAGVFINRLQKRMRLQSDPTIVYGLVGGKGTLGRPISRAELEKITPYNTYSIDGLPPGPIANPGRAALEAVANPSRTQELYFVADGTGGHVFSETLDQHVRNVQKWRQIEKEARDKQLVPDADKLAPQANPAGNVPATNNRPDQRGYFLAPAAPQTDSVYGVLPATLNSTATSLTLISSLSGYGSEPFTPVWAAARTIAVGNATSSKHASAKRNGDPRAAKIPPSASAFAMGPSLDELGLSVRGVFTGALDAALDGPVDQSDSSDPAAANVTFPVSSARRAELKAHAAKLGLGSSPDALPPEAEATQDASVRPDSGSRRPKIIDVSEGTPLDPLADKTYDLNFAKTVPALNKF